MFQQVSFKDFRCFRSVDVPLGPLTVLIGPNDSGKSAFLRALMRLAGTGGFNKEDAWRFEENPAGSLVGDTASGQFQLEYGRHLKGPVASHPCQPCNLFQLPAAGISMKSTGYADHGEPPNLESNGGLVPALLDHLLRRDRKRFFAVQDAMRELVPGFEEIEIATPSAETRQVDLVVENGLRLPANAASAGVRLLLFFVALAYHPDPPRLILLEEPENGVHPKRLKDVMRLLREVSQGKHGDHAAQIVLTTHSPHLLDYVDLEHDQVLVFRRQEGGSRTAEPVDAERLKVFLDEFMLGEVWHNEGEDGLVGRGK